VGESFLGLLQILSAFFGFPILGGRKRQRKKTTESLKKAVLPSLQNTSMSTDKSFLLKKKVYGAFTFCLRFFSRLYEDSIMFYQIFTLKK